MKYSEAIRLVAADLHGTELICVLDRNGVTKVTTTAALKALMPITQGTGLLLANPKSTTGYRFADPTGELPEPVPVTPPTINQWQAAGTTSMYINWTDNQANPADAFLINVDQGGSPIVGSPFRVENVGGVVDNYTVTGLTPATSYTATMAAEAAGSQSQPSASATASTAIDSGSFVPVDNRTFEGGTVDALAFGPLAYDGMSNIQACYFDNSPVRTGTRSCRHHFDIASGPNADRPKGRITLPSSIGNGETFWVKCDVYFPTDYLFVNNSEGQKFMRAVFTAGNSWDCYITAQGLYAAGTLSQKNVVGDNALQGIYSTDKDLLYRGMGGPFTLNAWHTFEYSVKLTTDLTGYYKAWIDGVLVIDMQDFQSMRNTSDVFYDLALFSGPQGSLNVTYPADQDAWVDNIVVADSNSPPPNTDAGGNAMIGNWA